MHPGAQDIDDVPPFDLGYGVATAMVFEDSIIVSIPMPDECLKPIGYYREVCYLVITIGNYLSSIMISENPDEKVYTPLIYRCFVSKSAINRSVDYRPYDDVSAVYSGALHVIFGSNWATQALLHRPDRFLIRVGEDNIGALPIHYQFDPSGESS
jgi:hypothetical protein